MSDPVKMLGPGPSALYQTGQAGPVQGPTCFERDSRGSRIHQKKLSGDVPIEEISRDPFNILPEYRLVKLILKLAGKLRLTGKESAADASTRFRESRLLSFTRREPVFHRIIVQALTDNPEAVPAIRRAILQDNPGLLPVNKRITHEACRALMPFISTEIQAAKDSNLVKLFGEWGTYYTWQDFLAGRPNVRPLDNRTHAEAIRRFTAEKEREADHEEGDGHSSLIFRNVDLELIPQELSKFVSLRFLNLSGNKLSNVPDSFTNLKRMTTLFLGNNQFTRFPAALLELEHLTQLHMEDNMLDSIPETFALRLKQLSNINFSGNRLPMLPQNVYSLGELSSLNVSRNPDFDQSFRNYGFGESNGKVTFLYWDFPPPREALTITIEDTALAERIKSVYGHQSSSSSSSSTKRKREEEPLE